MVYEIHNILILHYKFKIIGHKSDITSLSQKAYQFHYYNYNRLQNCLHQNNELNTKRDKRCTIIYINRCL